MEESYVIYIVAFIFGSIIGSFLNVVIYRLPRKGSILKPVFSVCPRCGTQIKWYDNIPIISFFLLKGKCRYCKSPISKRYPLVETLTGLASVLSLLKAGLSIDYIFIFLFLSILIAITFIDIDFKIIPDELNLIGFLSGLFYSYFRVDFSVVDALLGAVVGAGILWSIAFIYEKSRGIEGLGFGDVKMMVFLGTYLGWFGSLFTIFFASLIGSIVGLAAAYISKEKNKGQYEIPFGPFLALGGAIFIFFGEEIQRWYLG
jgi:leader peptidase (prepilin peptidase)/N-methyltransferase